MSRYEWERGEIKLPSKDFPKFRRELVTWYNDRQKRLLKKALEIHARLAVESKSKDFDLEKALDNQLVERLRYLGFYEAFAVKSNVDGAYPIREALRTPGGKYDQHGRWVPQKRKLRKPLVKDFPTLKNSADRISLTDAVISFAPREYTVIWHVHENNHACDHARADAIAVKFFGMLQKVNWVRGTGGQIVGNDEYRSEDRDAGGGANYVKETFGPRGDQSSDPRDLRARRRSRMLSRLAK